MAPALRRDSTVEQVLHSCAGAFHIADNPKLTTTGETTKKLIIIKAYLKMMFLDLKL